MTETLHMGTHLRVLRESYTTNTNIIGFRCFCKTLHPYALDESSFSIGKVKVYSVERNKALYSIIKLYYRSTEYELFHFAENKMFPIYHVQEFLFSPRFLPYPCLVVLKMGERNKNHRLTPSHWQLSHMSLAVVRDG